MNRLFQAGRRTHRAAIQNEMHRVPTKHGRVRVRTHGERGNFYKAISKVLTSSVIEEIRIKVRSHRLPGYGRVAQADPS